MAMVLLRACVLSCALWAVSLPLAAAQQEPPPGFREALQAVQSGSFQTAETNLRRITEEHAQFARGWSLLGYALHAQGKTEEALAVHRKAAEFPQTAPTAHYNAACACALLGRTDDAFAHLEKARDAGYQNWGQLAADADLASIRNDPRFAEYLPKFRLGAEAFVEEVDLIHEWHGEAAGDEFGWVGRRIGDVDGDGVIDFATSAPSKALGGPQAGRVYAYSSKSGEELWRASGQPGQRFGNGVAEAGDVDADGTPDVVIGAPGASGGPGDAYVLSGKDGAVIRHFTRGEAGDSFGMKVCGAGDVNADGHADLLISAMKADLPSDGGDGSAKIDAGAVFLYSGKDGAELWRVHGEAAGDSFGSAVDATMDEHGFVAIGAMNAGPGNRGRVYLFQWTGERLEPRRTFDADSTGANLGQYFVAFPGDVNGDGAHDLFATDFTNTANGNHTGRAYVWSTTDGKALLTLTGKTGEGFGTSISQAGDVNGDGCADLVIGAWQQSSAAPSGGAVYLHSGKDGSLIRQWTCRQAGDTLGFDAQGLGDVDGDGSIDFLLTSGWAAVNGPKTGRVFLVGR